MTSITTGVLPWNKHWSFSQTGFLRRNRIGDGADEDPGNSSYGDWDQRENSIGTYGENRGNRTVSYAYTGNNSINYADSDGHKTVGSTVKNFFLWIQIKSRNGAIEAPIATKRPMGCYGYHL